MTDCVQTARPNSLCRAGTSAVEAAQTGRSEQIYEAVTAWLAEALPRRDDVRDDLVLKVLLARRSGLLDPQDAIDAQRTATMQALQDLHAPQG